MSAVAGRLPTVGRPRRRALPRALGRALTADTLLTAGVAAALAGLAFYAQGGVELDSNTYAEVLLVAAGGTLSAAALAAPTRHARLSSLHGRTVLGLFGVLAVLTALSVIWSVDPGTSWVEADRTFAYLASFAGALALARLVPSGWAAVVRGVGLAAVIVCGWALLTKVLPSQLAPDELYARLRAPFGYWNAVGLMAASGVPPLLWLAARRSRGLVTAALAYPGLGLLLVCLMLAYSRGSLLALGVGLVVWFAIVPLRLRSALALVLSGAAAAAVVAWAFAQPALTEDRITDAARDTIGHKFGLLLALMLVVLLTAGLAAAYVARFRAPAPRVRTLAGRALIGALVAALAAGVVALALAPGGIDGQVSKAWHHLTDPNARTPANTPNRLTATASVRARYWREALDVHATSPLLGVGAGGYGLARKRFRTGNLEVEHAHGYVVQTLADLGWIGLVVSVAAALAWLAAAAAALGLRRSDRGRPWDPERFGMAALLVVVVIFGVHSAIDWTWFVPANAVMALVCAGWVAGRGPLRDRLAAEGASAAATPPPRWSARDRLLRWQPDPVRTAAATGVAILAVAVMWTSVQPLRAEHASDASLARLSAGEPAVAASIARLEARRDPLTPQPYWDLAIAEAAQGHLAATQRALEHAVRVAPADPESWRRLGRFRLDALHRPREALRAFRAALYLDPQSPLAQSDVIEASRAAAAPTTVAPTP